MARLTGKDAAVYVNNGGGWNYVVDIFDWVCDTELVVLDVAIKGDNADRKAASHTRGKLSAKRHTQVGGTLGGSDFLTPGVRLDFAVVIRDPSLSSGTLTPDPTTFSSNTSGKIQGTGYLTTSHVTAPRGMATDEFEITFDTMPVIT